MNLLEIARMFRVLARSSCRPEGFTGMKAAEERQSGEWRLVWSGMPVFFWYDGN
jgi:hypothetical protein